MVDNFGTIEHIELILVPIDQKLAVLTDRDRNFWENFLTLFLANYSIRRGTPFTFCKVYLEKPLYPYQKAIAVE